MGGGRWRVLALKSRRDSGTAQHDDACAVCRERQQVRGEQLRRPIYALPFIDGDERLVVVQEAAGTVVHSCAQGDKAVCPQRITSK